MSDSSGSLLPEGEDCGGGHQFQDGGRGKAASRWRRGKHRLRDRGI